MKSTRSLHNAVLGLLGGLASWTLMQSGFHAFDALSVTGLSGLNIIWLNKWRNAMTLIGD